MVLAQINLPSNSHSFHLHLHVSRIIRIQSSVKPAAVLHRRSTPYHRAPSDAFLHEKTLPPLLKRRPSHKPILPFLILVSVTSPKQNFSHQIKSNSKLKSEKWVRDISIRIIRGSGMGVIRVIVVIAIIWMVIP